MINTFFYNYRKYLLLGFYLIISIAFMISKSEKVNINIKSAINSVIYPFHSMINSTKKTIDNFWVSIEELNILKKELMTTRHEVERLKGASVEIEELKKENEHLRSILEIKTKIEYPTIYAEIIGRDPSNYYYIFIINKGANSGIKRNMPVITYQDGIEGVVGKVIEVSKNSAKILPINGIGSYIGGMLSGLRYIGIIKGQGQLDDNLHFDYIDKNAILNFGDLVVTSGQGGVFPKGLNIGKVMAFIKVKYGIFYKEIKVKPIVDFSRLEDVYVILKEADEDILESDKVEIWSEK